MSIKDQILNIPELTFTDEWRTCTDAQFEKFIDVLKNFLNIFPSKEMNLKTAMATKNIDNLLKSLVETEEILRTIQAIDLCDECKRRLNSFDRNNPEKTFAYIYFLCASMESLGNDIQKALIPQVEVAPHDSTDVIHVEPRITKNVLAVDDDVYCLHLFKAAVRDLPCKIIACNSGKEALAILNKVRIHVIVLDIDMPFMNGIELAHTLRNQGFTTPIIFLTGNATKDNLKECLACGAADFIVKPINPEQVASRIRRLLM